VSVFLTDALDPLDRDVYPVDPWRLIELAVPASVCGPEEIFALGNGFVGVSGILEENDPTPACFVNGFYETWRIKYPEDAFGLARTGQAIQPAPMPVIQLTVDGHLLGDSRVEQRRELDMATGVMTRQTIWQAPTGPVEVKASRLVSFSRRGLVAGVIDVAPSAQSEVEVACMLGPARRGPRGSQGRDPRSGTVLEDPAIAIDRCVVDRERATFGVRTLRAGRHLVCMVDHRLSHWDGPSGSITPESTTVDESGAETVWRVSVPNGGRVRLVMMAWYATGGGDEMDAVVAQSGVELDAAVTVGWDGLVKEQTAWLDDFWKTADVEVDDPALQQAVRWSIFQTIQASGRADGLGIAAKGVTGLGYDGHYFWDMETYVLPFLTYVRPAAARAALGFRLATLPQARERAAELSLKGALFPWRTINGREASAYYPAGTAQYHIDADIAHALMQYVAATGDETIMTGKASMVVPRRAQEAYVESTTSSPTGLDLLVGTARMWASRGFWGDDGAFHIHYVTGPDEYSALVDDNVYTNLMARANLRAAADAVSRWGDSADAPLHDDVAEWRRIADGMFVPYDAALGVHPQDAHFMGLEPWDLASIPRENFPLLLHYHPLTIYRHKVLKQADVVLAQILCPDDFTETQKRANFDFYDPLTTGDSTLSAVPQAIGAVEAGHLGLAADYLVRACFVDLANSHGNTDAGVHVAVTAGVWSALVMGFGGLRDGGGGILRLAPRLPDGLTRLKFHLLWHGTRLDVMVTPSETTLHAEGPEPVELMVWGNPVTVQPGRSSTVILPPSPRPAEGV